MMKNWLLLSLVYGAIASAQEMTTILPGASIIVAPGKSYRIHCADDKSPADVYCKCVYQTSEEKPLKSYVLVRKTIFAPDQVLEDRLDEFDQDQRACRAAIAANPACRKR